MSKKQKKSILKTKPIAIITVTDRKGKKQIVKTYKKYIDLPDEEKELDVERLWAVVNNNSDEFLIIQYFTFDNLTRKYQDFLSVK